MAAFILFLLISLVGLATCQDLSYAWKPSVELEECGHKTVFTSITGGLKAKLGAYPYHVALTYSGGRRNVTYGCGGSLINSLYVLTSAYCASGLNAGLKLE